MSNGDEAMSPEEFAKLMGAYPEPAQNPLPAYGGYMDNSPANFAWVQNNDYFGAEGDWIYHDSASPSQKEAHIASMEMWSEALEDNPNDEEAKEQFAYWYEVVYKNRATPYNSDYDADTDLTPTNHMNNSIGQVVPITNPMELPTNLIETEAGGGPEGQITPDVFSADFEHDTAICNHPNEVACMGCGKVLCWDCTGVQEYTERWTDKYGTFTNELELCEKCFDHREKYGAETFEAPYGGLGALMDIGKETPLADFTGKELAESSAIHGDFDQASLNYSGHQNLEVRAESNAHLGKCLSCGDRAVELDIDIPHCLSCGQQYDAEMEELTESIVDVSNRFGQSVGIITVEDDDDIDSYEDVNVEVQDTHGNVVETVTLEEDGSFNPYEDDYMDAEMSKPSMLTLGLGAVAVVLGWPYLKDMGTKVFGADNDTQDMLENDPELVENPDTGDLDPAQYEELVVESTGYAVDVIPMGLDASFMGSRFQALPTERYVEYNDPGIGAHTDVALNRDELFLEPEMAMVQAAEEGNEVKEAQAPGQSPYMSVDGQEPKDFNYRVIHEVSPISLDPAVKPFIPQSMTGYTGNKNTPPSVMNKMFNIGVLGQTPLFVAGQGDMGSSHTGSRDATPNSLGIAGSVGGPLSDQVNANYTDGTTSMSLAQWAIENTVSQSSDTEAVVVDRSSGAMKRIRRV